MKISTRFLVCALTIVMAAGCGFTNDRNEAAQIAAAFYESVKADDINGIIVHISPEFFKETSESKVRLIFPAIKDTLGTLESYELSGWHVNKQLGNNPLSGIFVTLQYKVLYSDTLSYETLIMYRANSEDHFKIISYNFSSEN
ncbi:MAG: hypothetical protein KAR42_09225 [candidate division Zixibacteria bacterium]|nr:hypothetical protein [candidate division Zixibacteria bacterium]